MLGGVVDWLSQYSPGDFWQAQGKTLILLIAVLVISPIVVAKSVEWFNDWNFPLFLLSGLFAIGTVCWLFIDPRTPVFESGSGD